jgi:hypothetical protein
MGKTRKAGKRAGQVTIREFMKVVGDITDRMIKNEDDGKNLILRVFAGVSPINKRIINTSFLPINESLDISKPRDIKSKINNFRNPEILQPVT